MTQPGGLKVIGHVVVLMQENRSFDHYFGTMRGVRGCGDRTPRVLPSGRAVSFQPRPGGGDVLTDRTLRLAAGHRRLVEWPVDDG